MEICSKWKKMMVILMILSTFMYSVYSKITDFDGSLQGIQNKGLPVPYIALLYAMLSQFVGILLIVGSEMKWYSKDPEKNEKYKNWGKALLISFILLTLWYYHNIFTMDNQIGNFVKNVGLMGGVILI